MVHMWKAPPFFQRKPSRDTRFWACNAETIHRNTTQNAVQCMSVKNRPVQCSAVQYISRLSTHEHTFTRHTRQTVDKPVVVELLEGSGGRKREMEGVQLVKCTYNLSIKTHIYIHKTHIHTYRRAYIHIYLHARMQYRWSAGGSPGGPLCGDAAGLIGRRRLPAHHQSPITDHQSIISND